MSTGQAQMYLFDDELNLQYETIGIFPFRILCRIRVVTGLWQISQPAVIFQQLNSNLLKLLKTRLLLLTHRSYRAVFA